MHLSQSEWHGLPLAELARASGSRPDVPPSPAFYRLFYQRLREMNYAFNQAWLEAKNLETERMRYYLDHASSTAGGRAKAASIGAGLGVVEAPLLEAGYDLTLQECQDESFDYLRRRGLSFRCFIGPDLTQMPGQPFDIAFMFTVSYVVAPGEYAAFLSGLCSILRPGGKLVLWDPLPTWRNLPLARRVLDWSKRRESIFWGWLRTPREHAQALRRAGFALDEIFVTGSKGNVVRRLAPSGAWRWGQGVAQYLVAHRA